MEERALRVLEFHRFVQKLKDYASSEVGQNLCLTLGPSRERGEVETLLRQAAEASALLQEEGDIPMEGVHEVRPLLQRIHPEGSCLLPGEFLPLRSTLGAAGRVKQFLGNTRVHHPRLQQWMEEIPEFKNLYADLQSALGPRGEILDSASPELRRLRKEISRIRSRIRNALAALWEQENLRKIFQDQIVTLRNERYVVAVKSEFKNILPGIIHDQSQSRATYFIEPFSTVEENNELNLLVKDEREEERRVLLRLTTLVREQGGEVIRAVEILGRLDLVMAKAKYARAMKGTIPLLNEQGYWRLPNARHPLIEPQAVVPIDLHLDNGKSTLVITGANTGGKTVALKTLGLLTLMAQCGIPIPAAEGSEVAVFRNIFADIGDEQSLQDNLSTFSAWVQTAARIVKAADKSSLILLDEVGGGTDPGEGAALTMALIDTLRERGAKTVVTTHLHLLKAYGARHPDLMNVSVEFDAGTLRPTYRLIYGRPGESYALPMAEKWGFPPELVKKAKDYLGEGDRQVMELLQSLEQTQREMETKRQEWDRLQQEAEAARIKAEAFRHQTEKEIESSLTRAREEAQTLVRQAKEDLRGLINEFKAKGRTDVHHLEQAIRAEEQKINRWRLPESPEGGAGQDKGRNGQRSDLSGEVDALSQLKGGRVKKSGEKKKEKPPKHPGFIHYQIPCAARELNVIGLRVEEALPTVDKAIDEAFLAGLKELEVIHGAGSGRLRQAIREHLRNHIFVKAFLPGSPGRGGDGVTVVEIGPTPAIGRANRRSGKKGLGQN
ncbi:MAG: endonuclease MutS2 [Deltaproteobacteria bacterium]|nr:endonuclease MutS2 [Deltaproteobacteria bacterium]